MAISTRIPTDHGAKALRPQTGEGQIFAEQGLMGGALISLKDCVGRLRDILLPVMRSEIEDDAEKKEPPMPVLVPVADAMRESRMMVEGLIREVTLIIDWLELPK